MRVGLIAERNYNRSGGMLLRPVFFLDKQLFDKKETNAKYKENSCKNAEYLVKYK